MRSAMVVCALLTGAAQGSVAAVSDLDFIRGTEADTGFARATAPVTLEFPRDQGPHPQFRHEWWYLTGNLDSAGGQRFGFELTFTVAVWLAPSSSVTVSEAVHAPRA